MAKTIGIDLGTSNSAAACMVGGRPTIIPSSEGISLGGKAFPSVVAFTKDSQVLVGEPARRQIVTNPDGSITGIKRRMGTDYKAKVHGKEYTPQQISSFLLQKIKRDAEAFLGDKVDKAVITVPAYFNDNQRQATKDAGEIAGLEVIRIINEPTAASLAYGLDKGGTDQKIMVFDLGGGTLDVTNMEFGGGVFEVKSTSGDTRLGGTDMDDLILEHLHKKFLSDSGIDISNDNTAMTRLREAVEKAKIELSTTLTTDINLPFIASDKAGPKHLSISLSRATLEQLVRPVIERCRGPTTQALADAKLKPEDVNRVVLVGGPTRMPIVQNFLRELMGKEPERGVEPMECVALGASIQAGVLAGEVTDLLLLDVTPLSLGVETLGGVITHMIERNTTIPTKKTEVFSTAEDFQTVVTIHVLQGERPMATDNTSLGRFNLEGIPPAPRGVPKIEVTFDIDANGILSVSAKDIATNKEQKITITAGAKMNAEEKERMIKEAEQFSEQDKKRKEEVELVNEAESMIYTAQKTKDELKDRLPPEQAELIGKAIDELNAARKENDSGKIKTKLEELRQVVQQASATVYQQESQQQPGQSEETSGGPEYKPPPPEQQDQPGQPPP